MNRAFSCFDYGQSSSCDMGKLVVNMNTARREKAEAQCAMQEQESRHTLAIQTGAFKINDVVV